jgi:hypothetical protein
MIFSSRKKEGPDPHFLWKVRLFFAGAVTALLGIGLDSSVLVGLGTVVLLLGAGLRFFPGGEDEGGRDPSDEDEAPPEDQDSGEAFG